MDIGVYVGLDVHKDSIAVGQALSGREDPVSLGVIANDGLSVRRLLNRMSSDGPALSFCYEAGPCGYGLYRQIVESGQDCIVVAPEPGPASAWRQGEDGPPGSADACTTASFRGSHGLLGSRSGGGKRCETSSVPERT